MSASAKIVAYQTQQFTVAAWAKLAKKVHKMGSDTRSGALKFSDDAGRKIQFLFQIDWIPQIMQAAAEGRAVQQIDTQFSSSDSKEAEIMEFFKGSGFGVSHFTYRHVHPQLKLLSFHISWLS